MRVKERKRETEREGGREGGRKGTVNKQSQKNNVNKITLIAKHAMHAD